MLLLKNIFYFLLIIGLSIGFILTGTYYLFVLVFVMSILYIINLIMFYPLCFFINMNIMYKNELLKSHLFSKLILPLGSISGELILFNEFFQEEEKVKLNCLIGDKKDEFVVYENIKIGSYKLLKHKIYAYDLLKLHKKRIKKVNNLNFTKVLKIYYFEGYDHLQTTIREHTQNNSDEYEIKEYKIGDSIKDIHYKVSYKLSKLMIKDKLYSNKDIHIYLDLSGNEKDIIKVFSYLYFFIESIESMNKKCLIYWHSREQLNSYMLKGMNDYQTFITYVLSKPKATLNEPMVNSWIITKNGVDGGDCYEE